MHAGLVLLKQKWYTCIQPLSWSTSLLSCTGMISYINSVTGVACDVCIRAALIMLA